MFESNSKIRLYLQCEGTDKFSVERSDTYQCFFVVVTMGTNDIPWDFDMLYMLELQNDYVKHESSHVCVCERIRRMQMYTAASINRELLYLFLFFFFFFFLFFFFFFFFVCFLYMLLIFCFVLCCFGSCIVFVWFGLFHKTPLLCSQPIFTKQSNENTVQQLP